MQEYVSSYTSTILVPDERKETLRDAILKTCLTIRPIANQPATVRTDSASSFKALVNDKFLRENNIVVEIGNPKNKNSNPVAEKAVQDMEKELLKIDPTGARVSSTALAIACNNLNTRIGSLGLSPREILFRRDQFTSEHIHFEDMDLITKRQHKRDINHSHSEQSKAPNRPRRPRSGVEVGDVVYLHQDLTKNKGRERYIVSSKQDGWVRVRKFAGSQLRASTYKVREEECFRIPSDYRHISGPSPKQPDDDDDDDNMSNPLTKPVIPDTISPIVSELANQYPTTPLQKSLVGSPTHDENKTPAETAPPDIQRKSRPVRNREKPAYLKDYYTDF